MRTPDTSPPAHVDAARWYEWGEVALARARAAGVPILLWIRCARSSCACGARFRLLSQPGVRALIRRRFIGVAVDPGARPDVVEVCRRLASATGRSGCPVAVVLTPGGQPFHIVGANALIGDPRGTAAYLERVADGFSARPGELAAQASGLVELLRLSTRLATPTGSIDGALLDRATAALREQIAGGTPLTGVPALTFLVARGAAAEVADLLRRDHHRVTAHLTGLYLQLWRTTGDPGFRRLARHGAARLLRTLDDSAAAGDRGQLVATLADAARDLDDATMRAGATQLADSSMRDLVRPDGTLSRFSHGGTGQLEDYAGFGHGLVRLYAGTGRKRWLEAAHALAITAVRRFSDPRGGGFFRTDAAELPLALRTKDLEDRPGPSGNSLLASVLLELTERLGDDVASRSAVAALRLVVDEADATPEAFGHALLTIHEHGARLL